jgi:ribose transport system ATP-binding protein
VLQVREISKSFPGVHALKGVSFQLYPGEILGLLGENGAGKSTLMKILAGIQEPDTGDIMLDDQVIEIHSVADALKHGIVLIHQELNLCDNLDLAGNIYLGREFRKFGFIQHRKMRESAKKELALVGLNVPPQTSLAKLPVGQQQMVEIAKALSIHARILILDEPTSSLSHKESMRLFEVIKDLKKRGVSIIYISHRLAEVEELADRVVVLRDGSRAGEIPKGKINRQTMIPMMVGRDVTQIYARKPHPPGEKVLELKEFSSPEHPRSRINLTLRKGEVVGMAGLIGAGRTELIQCLFGITQPAHGTVEVHEKKVRIRHPQDAIKAGMALVPEDRKQHGLVLEMTVAENTSLTTLNKDAISTVFLNSRKQNERTQHAIDKLAIKTPSMKQLAQVLSGGNQQKIVIGKWLETDPEILLLDEPTRGIDVGAKQEIYQLIDRLAAQGMAIILISSEMEEVIGLSDRVLVMHEGKLAGELKKEEINEINIIQLATGEALAVRA